MKEEEKTKKENEKKPKPKPQKTSDEFKRKYFEYYDDIKISDRQDW